MKKIYTLLLILSLGYFSFGQTTLQTVDRPNILGVTNSGSATNTTSVGFTRGPGTVRGTNDAQDYTWGGLGGADEATAMANDDYLSWSITANPGYIINATEVSIALTRNSANGPTAFRIFYSLDGFTTAGIPVSASSSSFPPYNSNFSNMIKTFNGFTATSPVGGTVTFRMYSWGGANELAQSYLRIFGITSWNELGISNPGARVRGSIVPGGESNIVTTAFDPEDNIDYSAFSAVSGLTTENAIKIGEFSIQDGGDDLTDADSAPTTLTGLGLDISNFDNIAALALFDGSSNVSEVTSVSATSNFSGINGGAGIVAADDAAKTFSVYATFKDAVTDNQQIQLAISSAIANASNSQFTSTNAGGASTPVGGDDNRIEVTATNLIFDTNPSDSEVASVMTPSVTVYATDGNVNFDLDFTGSVLLTPSTPGIFDPAATTTVNAVAGLATFNNLGFDTVGTDFTLTASSETLITDTSTPFDIFAAPAAGFQINAPDTDNIINFDTTVTGVNQGTYNGTGIVRVPSTGQLDSDSWSTTGISDGASAFGTDKTTGDFARGSSAGAVTEGGFYSFMVGTSNSALGVQPTEDDFTPGTVILRSKNNTGIPVTRVLIQYKDYVYNDQDRSNSLNFAYSNNNTTYTTVTDLNLTSPQAASGSPSWVLSTKTVILQGLNIPDGSFFYLRWRGNDVAGTGDRDQFAIDDILVNFQPTLVTTFTYEGGVWAPNNPSGSANPNNIIIVRDGNAIISDNTLADSVNVEAGATLTVNSDSALNATETTLESNSTQFASLILATDGVDTGSITGDISYQRYTNLVGTGAVGTGGNDLLSPPLMTTGQTFQEFLDFGSPAANSSVLATNGSLYAFGPYDNAAQTYINFGVTDETVLERGKGYRAASINASDNLLTFSGTVETGSVPRTINTPIGGSQWNLIGNPYPSYMTSTGANSFLNAANQAALDPSAAAIYGYNSGTGPASGTIGNFTIINNVSNSSINIAPGQGFLVANNTADGAHTITFDYNMTTTSGTDDFILGRDASASYSLRLKASSGANNFATEFYFNSNSGLGLDPGYDAALLDAFTNNFEIYSHLVENNTGRHMAIQSLGTNDVNDVTIPLGLKAAQGQQVTIAIETSSLPSDIQVYLEDTLNNTFTLLNNGDYIFTADSAINGTGRFFLRTSNTTLSTNSVANSSLQLYTQKDTLFVNGLLHADSAVKLYDLQGRLVLSSTLLKGTQTNQMDVSSINTGIYIVNLSNATQQKTQKVIIK